MSLDRRCSPSVGQHPSYRVSFTAARNGGELTGWDGSTPDGSAPEREDVGGGRGSERPPEE